MCTQINDRKSERKYVTGCILHNENKFAGIFVTVLSWLSILGYCEHVDLLPYDLSFHKKFSVSDPYHFDADPDPDPRIRIRDDGSGS